MSKLIGVVLIVTKALNADSRDAAYLTAYTAKLIPNHLCMQHIYFPPRPRGLSLHPITKSSPSVKLKLLFSSLQV